MKSDRWYFFLFCFQVEVLTGEVNDFAKSEIFIFHNGGVQILCKCPESVWQFRMQLLKGTQTGTQTICDLSRTKGIGNTISTQNLKFCQLSNNSVSYYLNNLDHASGNSYSCKLSIFDPPPFKEIVRKEYLHIYESQLCCRLKFWLPICCAVFVVVNIFGCTFYCWLKKKKYPTSVHDPNSEYMFMAAVNTTKKPRLTDVTHNLGPFGTQA
ncbi:inducible T-cell costimulator [Molossus molossus]|uniref:Inducible T-cell costimulator n=1 Tax=Molossus molossus TaxID=27622 RepID=A0A7J8FRE5_MOLMO|nr:inducible T-cell costimulator [Molossus molossus]KAF6450294.1 inducible T cell costimulator [Molossus molossus]